MAGVCLSSLVTHSGSHQEAPVVIWSPPDHLLQQPKFHRHHLGVSGLSLHAWRLFARSQGFSKHVAKQSALARRSSSRAGYQLNGPFIGNGATWRAILSRGLLCLRLLIFCFGCVGPRSYRSRLSWVTVWCCLRCFDRFCRRFRPRLLFRISCSR